MLLRGLFALVRPRRVGLNGRPEGVQAFADAQRLYPAKPVDWMTVSVDRGLPHERA
jgi:hypothetical protein